MDGLIELLGKSDRPGVKFNESIDGFETWEIYSDGDSIHFRTRRILNNDVVPWLNQREGEVGNEDSCDILRVVWVTRKFESTNGPWEDEMTKKNHDLVLDCFDLKKTYQAVTHGSLICLPMDDRRDLHKQHFALAMFAHTGTLIWTHDLMTNRTEAVWYGDNESVPFSSILPVLDSQKKLARHPMFLALIALICTSQTTQAMIEPVCDKINQVENRTQHCPAHLLRPSIAEGSYADLSAMMSGTATRLAGLEGCNHSLADIFDSVLGYKWPQGVTQPGWAGMIANEIDECVLFLKKTTNGQNQRIRYLSQRADIQLTALFNLITQQGSRLSISVAEDSRTVALATKEDSTAMRILAAVTVFFLPGTFVAAFFAMPMFKWDPQPKVLSRQFWVYWAVAVPLTLGTLALWLVWMRLQTRRRRARDSEGREALYSEINAPQRELRKKLNGMLKMA